MKKSLFPALVIFTFLALSCNNSQNRSSANNLNNTPQEKGKVIPEISCLKDPSKSYSLYLPSNYSAEKKYPLILAFDPHGSGNLPVEKYKALAEQYGYILMGSNNSRNSQPINETESIVNSMFEEINTRYSVDTARIYLMGFSGGIEDRQSRCTLRRWDQGVIACGAGFREASPDVSGLIISDWPAMLILI